MAFRAPDTFWNSSPAPDRLERRLRENFAVEPLSADFMALVEALDEAAGSEGGDSLDEEPEDPSLDMRVALTGTW